MSSFTSKLPKREPPPSRQDQIPPNSENPNPNPNTEEDAHLSNSSVLSREEVLRRRCRRMRKLQSLYREQYWALAEEVRAKLREYYWSFGVSPEDDEESPAAAEADGDDNKGVRTRCAFGGCKSMAMPLTRFCHSHVLADKDQTLYKGCCYVTRSASAQSGPVVCNKPILRGVMPSLCPAHYQKSQKQLSQAMKKAGINLCSLSRPTEVLNTVLLECVWHIQAKRMSKKAKRGNMNASVANITEKDKVVS